MKSILKTRSIKMMVLYMLAGSMMFQFMGCKKTDPKPKDTEIVKEKLTNTTWTLQNVTVDDIDQTAVYQGLTINFTETTYSTAKGGLVWPSSGTWSFTDETATTIKRDDGMEIKIDVSEVSLKLTLTWAKTTLGTGRLESVKGLHVFTFSK